MGKSTISMAIFHCYVSSPEGTWFPQQLLETLSLRPHSRSNGAKAESLGTRNVCFFKNPVSLSQEKSLANVFQPLAPVGNRKLKLRLFGKTRKLPGHLKPFEVFYWRSSCQWPQPILLKNPCQGKSCVLKRPHISFSRFSRGRKTRSFGKGDTLW